MLKRVAALFSLILIMSSCSQKHAIRKSVEAYNYDYFRYYETIYGKVKSLQEVNYFITIVKGDSINIEPTHAIEYNYDNEGLETDINNYYVDGRLHWKVKNEYDYKKLKKIFYYNDESELRFYFIYSYDKNGNIAKWEDYFKTDSLRAVNIYKNVDNNIEISHFNEQNIIENKFSIKYDKSDNMTEQYFFDANGLLVSVGKFKYDSLGNLVEENTYDSKGTLVNKVKNKYRGVDQEGNWLEKFIYINDTPTYKVKRTFEFY